ncbi:MAG: disulfide bond formation protein DsbA [Rhodospirillales bacterium 20-64-7]|nr:MAG: disulfide bond formation protein DsbA [Rhodospirillales bacterium 20-64-7]
MSDEAEKGPLTIDVISDVVCPWCYMGSRRLKAALAARPNVPVEVRWRPFQLDPTIPPEGLDRHEYMARKFGPDRIAEIHLRLETAGREVGIPFAFDAIRRSPNTLDAHRLIRWAQGTGRQTEIVEALFHAYFAEGRDIGERTLLAEIAGAHGLDPDLVRVLLQDGSDEASVREEIATAVRMGVSGVPFFLFGGRFGVPGAQAVEVLTAAIDKALEAGDTQAA